MKRLYTALAIAASLTASTPVLAQGPRPDFQNEITLGGGGSLFLKPHGTNMQGGDPKISYIGHLNYHRYLGDHFSAGLDVSMTSWKSEGTVSLMGLEGASLGDAPQNVVFGDRVMSFMAYANKVHWQYDEFYYQKSNFYYGLAVGMVFTNDNGPDIYSQFQESGNAENRYLSQYNYERGIGIGLGVQLGANFYFNNHLGFNVEASPRFVQMFTKNYRQYYANDRFNTAYFPVSIGLSYRF